MLVVAATASSVDQEFAELSAFLEEQGGSPDPVRNLHLIKVNRHELKRSYLSGSIIDLISDPSCQIKYSLAPIGDHFKRNDNKVLRKLFSHVAQIHLDICKQKYQLELAKALSYIGDTRKNDMLHLLSDNFIREFRSINAALVDSILGENRPGDIIKQSIPLLADFIQPNSQVNSDSSGEKDTLDGFKSVGKRINRFCPLFYKKASKLVENLRQIVALAGGGQRVASSFSDNLRDNLFRFKYCEDVFRYSKSLGE